MTSPMEPRVVLVTGAAGGLGTALVAAFRQAGWRVAAASRCPLPCPDPAADADLLPLRFDVRHAAEVQSGVDRVLDRWGGVDVLVNNAGIRHDALLARVRDEDLQTVLDTHLKGAFLCARAVLPRMLTRGRGHILNIGSWAGRAGAAGQSLYAAAKAGLAGLTVSLAREVGAQGIQVNAVLPGVMPTPMTRDLPGSVMEAYASANVLGRLNDPAEVAAQIVFLASQRSISGQVFALDSRIARWD